MSNNGGKAKEKEKAAENKGRTGERKSPKEVRRKRNGPMLATVAMEETLNTETVTTAKVTSETSRRI